MFGLMGNCISCIKQRRQPKRCITLAMLGLDSAGKTTTTKALIGDDLETAPTIGFSKEEFTFGKYEITLYDLGGGRKIRDIWKDYLAEIYGVVYVVDSSARERVPEVKESLNSLLNHEQVQQKPLLVLANKVDLPKHMNEVDMMEELSLEEIVNKNKCPTKLEMCSAIKGTGKKMDANIKNGFTWLCGVLDQTFEKLKKRVDADVAVMEEKQQREKEERRARVKKAREEREKKEEEERKRLGVEKEEEDEEEDDIIEGDPFRKLTAAEVQKKEERFRKAKEKEKEKKKRLKELDGGKKGYMGELSMPKNTNNNENEDDDDMFRAPRSSRNMYSLGVINGGFTKPVLGRPSRDDSDNEEENLSNMPRSGRQMLPPLQSPLGTKFMGVSPRPAGKEKKKNKKLKNKPVETIAEDDYSYRTSNHMNGIGDVLNEQPSLSYSRIQVATRDDQNSDDTERSTERYDSNRGGRRSYVTSTGIDNEVLGSVGVGGERKKGRKKKSPLFSNDEEEDFDTLRLSQHLEEEVFSRYKDSSKPPLSPDDSNGGHATEFGQEMNEVSEHLLFSNEEEEGFDTLRLSQHLEEEVFSRYKDSSKPPLSPVGGKTGNDPDNVRKLKKKKKKPPLRKNKLAPSDDEFELSDVQSSPKKQPLPWTRTPSPRKMLDDVDTRTNWGMADELTPTPTDTHSYQRRRPNFDSEDDLIL